MIGVGSVVVGGPTRPHNRPFDDDPHHQPRRRGKVRNTAGVACGMADTGCPLLRRGCHSATRVRELDEFGAARRARLGSTDA